MNYLSGYWDDVAKAADQIPNLERLYGKSVFITGATGLVCSSVVDIITYMNSQKADIHLILAGRSKSRIANRFSSVLSESQYEYVRFDALEDTETSVHTDYIIHGASIANPQYYAQQPAETLLGNIIGLNSLMKIMKNNSDARLLYVSSSEVYGKQTDNSSRLLTEGDYGYIDVLNPRACYPTGKRAAETLCACYAEEYGVDYVIVRPGHIYGPSITESDVRASASFLRDVLAKRDIVMKSAGNQLRSYCYSLDCASAILTTLINGVSREAYNISNRKSVVTIRELAEQFAKTGGIGIKFVDPSDEEKKGYNLMSYSALSSEKLESLGWQAYFTLEKGVESSIKYGG